MKKERWFEICLILNQFSKSNNTIHFPRLAFHASFYINLVTTLEGK